MPGTNAWTLSVITAFLRLAADAKPFISMELGEACHDWVKKMKMVLSRTKVRFPLKEYERSMTAYMSYKSYMAKLRVLPGTATVASDPNAMTVATIITCEWMRNSAKVGTLLLPGPTTCAILQQNLWRDFGDPPAHMDYDCISSQM